MKILFVATVQSHIAQFHGGAIDLLKEMGYEIHVAARDNLAEKNGLRLSNVDKVYNIPFDRSPFSTKNIVAYRKLNVILRKEKYDIVHCNTPVGGILARISANKYRRDGCCVIYTAHGFHFYKGASKRNWILFYPIEKVMSKYTDKLITINNEDYNLAKQKFSCPVYHLHGVGIKTQKYDSITKKNVQKFRIEQGWDKNFLIVCTGELNLNKNQETVILAIQEVKKQIPNVKLLLAGNGPNESSLRKLIHEQNLDENVELLGYRTDLEWFVHASDIVVSASFREGLPLNIAEAMYCGKPVVASLNRGHSELVKHGKTGYLVKATNPHEFANRIIELALNKDKRDIFGEAAMNNVKKYTDISVRDEFKKIYGLL